MSEPMKKPGRAPESYDPHEVPEIVKMAGAQGNLRPQETLVESFNVNGITVEVVDWRETIWCGKLAYGRKPQSEPDVEKLLDSYLKLDNPKLTREPTEPDWSVCMSLNYLSERPRGILFGMQVDTEAQPKVYDVYKVPPARFMRVLICEETAKALGVEMWHGGIPPYQWIGEHIAPRYGYRYGKDTLPVFEYYGYYDPETNKHKFCYLYVSVERVDAPESYDPQEVPEIVRMAGEASRRKTAVQAAPAMIKAKARNAVRIIELPACKMVTSGPVNDQNAWAEDGPFGRFNAWWVAQDKRRADRFYPRDFLWSSPGGGFEWGYAVTEAPENTGGWPMIDFPGGLYAVAVSVDADGKDHDRVYGGIQKWVKDSGCFALDETDRRRSLGNITSPMCAKEVMGYHQMDLYFPIRIKGENEK